MVCESHGEGGWVAADVATGRVISGTRPPSSHAIDARDPPSYPGDDSVADGEGGAVKFQSLDDRCTYCQGQAYVIVEMEVDGRTRRIAFCRPCFLLEADRKYAASHPEPLTDDADDVPGEARNRLH